MSDNTEEEDQLFSEIFTEDVPQTAKKEPQLGSIEAAWKSSKISSFLIIAICGVVLFSGLVYLTSTQAAGNQSGFILELVFLWIIFAAQSWALYVNRDRTYQLSGLFPHDFGTVVKERKARYIQTSSDVSKGYAIIIARLNNYLYKNAGASNDYGILKQIIELELKSVSQKASGFLSFPLFLGLAGTFLGVVFGLAGFASESSSLVTAQSAAEGADAGARAVSQLLGGVSIAMVGSFFGLLFTLIGQREYILAKEVAESKFNECLGFVQAELLPETRKDADQAYRTLAENLEKFNKGLARNLKNLDNNFLRAIQEAKESTIRELDIIKDIREIGVAEFVNGNSKLMSNLVPLLKAFEHVLDKIEMLEDAAESTTQMLKQYNEFYANRNEHTGIVNGLSQFVNDQGLITLKLTNLLTGNSENVSKLIDKLERSITEADVNFTSELQRRERIITKLLDQNNYQVENLLEQKSTKDTFEALKSLPATIKELSTMNGLQADQLKALLSYLIKLEQGVSTLRQNEGNNTATIVKALNKLEQKIDNNNKYPVNQSRIVPPQKERVQQPIVERVQPPKQEKPTNVVVEAVYGTDLKSESEVDTQAVEETKATNNLRVNIIKFFNRFRKQASKEPETQDPTPEVKATTEDTPEERPTDASDKS